ncbi:hypothetical protein ACFSSA_06010 [Luteolibacter algae]|uniref:Uncharacterized protein n=1 Tax=Luteolibacter algae TaxID=454151 RepID=A0ABW5D652_9BACT
MKLPHPRKFPLLAVFAFIQVGVLPSLVAAEEAAELPAKVRTPEAGDVNRRAARSEKPRSIMSDIPARPTRGQLEKIKSDGLVLANLSGNSKHKG